MKVSDAPDSQSIITNTCFEDVRLQNFNQHSGDTCLQHPFSRVACGTVTFQKFIFKFLIKPYLTTFRAD